MRIDHVLATPEFTFTKCWVGPDVGSDHLPLLAEVILPNPADQAGPAAAPTEASPSAATPGAVTPPPLTPTSVTPSAVAPPVSASPDASRSTKTQER
jgi:hypothetical protein